MRYSSRTLRSTTLRISLAAALGGVTLHAPGVLAQTDQERAGARAAATQGADAFSQQRYADAVDLFTRAESLVHSPSHLLYMARSYEKLGKLVQARETYLKITREAIPPNAPQAFRDAKNEAQTALTALEPRLPYITVQIEGGDPKAATVTMDGAKVPPALVGLPVPADPGEHKLQAVAPGLASDEAVVNVEEGKREVVALKMQPSSTPAAPAAEPGATGETAGTGAAEADVSLSPGKANGMRIGGFVALGVGAVGLGAGTLFLLKAHSKSSDADDLCTLPGGGCPASARDQITQLDDDAKSARTLATVGFMVGGLGVATGVTLLVLSSKSSGQKEQASHHLKPGVEPWLGYRSIGVQGRF